MTDTDFENESSDAIVTSRLQNFEPDLRSAPAANAFVDRSYVEMVHYLTERLQLYCIEQSLPIFNRRNISLLIAQTLL